MAQKICNHEDLIKMVQRYSFLPFFKNGIPGFSIEEHTPSHLWFEDGADGPWEWKGPVIRETGCAYGKFFWRKAGYIDFDWYLDFANYRRDGYDFDARYEDGLASHQEKYVYDILSAHSSLLSKELKELGGFRKDGRKGFDTIITRLQMRGYVLISDFEYRRDRYGQPYGWCVARYATPERRFGKAFINKVYRRTPQQSKERIIRHLSVLLPEATEKQKQIQSIVG